MEVEISTEERNIELDLTGYAYGGEALGRAPDGRMIFVAQGIPGERVRVELDDEHERWARAALVEVLKPSPQRIEPRCKHFGTCGGCHYQHIGYQDQLRAKREIVSDQLRRIGGLPQADVRATIPSPSEWNYRNHVQFHVNRAGKLSYAQSPTGDLFTVEECHLPEPGLSELWPTIAIEPGEPIERLSLRRFPTSESQVIFHGSGEPQFELTIDLPASVVWISPQLAAVLAGSGHLRTAVMGREFQVSAGSFFQVNSALTPRLVEVAMEALGPQSGQTCLDLYAGVGLFSAFMALGGARVIAAEQSTWSARDFEVNLDEFDEVELFEGDVADVFAHLQREPDGVLADPPRAGLGRKVTERLAGLHAGRLVYVSCDPATLARDARTLTDHGYKLQWVQPLDLFPQTYHIETVSLWLPTAG